MRAATFRKPGSIELGETPAPMAGPGQAVVRMTMTTICGTDVHILKGEYPVAPGRIVGHEGVGVIEALGQGVVGYELGDRVIVGAITVCGTCFYCQNGMSSQCAGTTDEWKFGGGWRFGNSIDGVQADYFLVPYAQGNLAKIPKTLTDEQVVYLTDIASTGISAAEKAQVKIGDSVAIYAQGPIGLCATAGAKLKGASLIIGIDSIPGRLAVAKRMGADVVINFREQDPIAEIKRLTGGRGVDIAIEALGLPQTFENCLRSVRPGGVVSSLGVYSGHLTVPVEPFVAGLGDHTIVTTLCPGGKERMRRLISLVESGRLDLAPLMTHRFTLAQIEEAYDLFAHQRDGVLKVGITP
jgi:threonine dehydrogenase-like Zn-dependent dehydrogenase